MAEVAVKVFVGKDDLVHVTGIVIAGLADLKHELNSPKILDKRVRDKVLRVVDVQYGMRKGLDEAILHTADLMREVKLVRDQKLLQQFMRQLADDDGLCSCGVNQTMVALEERAVATIICWENLAVRRYTLRNDLADDTRVVYWSASHNSNSSSKKKQAASELYTEPDVDELLKSVIKSKQKKKNDNNKKNGGDDVEAASMDVELVDVAHYRVVEQVPLVEWLADHYQELEAKLVFVSDSSEAGSQFVQSFGGLAGLLRFKVHRDDAFDDDDDDDDDGGFDDDWDDDFIASRSDDDDDDNDFSATAADADKQVKPRPEEKPKGEVKLSAAVLLPAASSMVKPQVEPQRVLPTASSCPELKEEVSVTSRVAAAAAVPRPPPGFEAVLPLGGQPSTRVADDKGGEQQQRQQQQQQQQVASALRYTGSVFVPRSKRQGPAAEVSTAN